ncbi:MAG: hypothetical protein PF517_13165 [Salinivirgaceae bacterium]|jgi:antitoxin component YwqK of YwqJK toxin-antitoxin module|nr:hypothetical protein [Salinivirgaceae bacterium]
MKSAKWIIGLIATAVLAYFIISETKFDSPKHDSAETECTQVKIHKSYNDDGSLKADVEMVDGLRHGTAHNYYKDGSVHSEMHYKNGKKDGTSTWFYEDGKPYRVSQFVKGVKHGISKKYYKNGQLMAEIPYLNNQLQPGTIEYSKLGKPLEQNLKFSYKVENQTILHQTVVIEITGKKMDEISRYSAFIMEQNIPNTLNGSRDKQAIRFNVPSKKGNVRTVEATIWLTSKTKLNNKIIIEKKLPLVLGKD